MEHRAADYFVKGRQLEKLERELETLEEFRNLVDNHLGSTEPADEGEREAMEALKRVCAATRELKYLAEDISGQVLAVFEG